ncbi:restriction endonuclease subunit S [Fusobacterium polymorphum]|jgi:restriction modification system DNA specificity domain protein|uniref:restriction endonuclease subunit S n=1 Tax=Fusobacterium nucleatum subsp. polymorphum TaxID=76857 RepID=UPI00300833DC
MAKNKKVEISLEEKLEKALIPVEEQPYKIPDNWVWTRLGEVINIYRGLSYTKNDEVENGYLVLRGNNLTDNGLAFLENIYVDEKVAKKGIEIKKDDVVLVSSTGSSKVIGRACVVEKDYEKTTIGAFLLLCRPKEIIVKKWIHYIFKTLRYRLYISEQAKGTNIKNIKNEYLENFYIPLPPLNEQKRIVEKLDFLFEKTKRAKEIIEEIKVDIENRKISILDRAFKGVLTSKWRNENKVSDVKELLKSINDEKIKKWEEECLQAEKEGKKKPKKPIIREIEDMIVPVDEQPYKLPDSWVWVKLDNLCSKITDGTHKTPKYTDSGVPFISVKDIYDNQVSFNNTKFISQEEHNELYKRCNPEYDDILLTKSGTIGRTAVIKTKTEFSLFVSVALLKNYKNVIDSNYLSLNIQDFFNKINISQTIKGGVIKNYHISDMKEQLIPLPPLEEQQEIVRILDEVLENENKVKELLELEERIDVLEKSILNKAFKGELGTQNSNDEPAIELLKEIL